MNETTEFVMPSKYMSKFIFAAAMIIILIGAVFYRSLAVIPFALGVLATSGLNIIKLRMIERTVGKVLDADDEQTGKNIVRLQYLFRYFLTGVLLLVIGLIQNYTTPPPVYSSREWYIGVWALLFPTASEAFKAAPLISIWGGIFGIFTLQISVLLLRVFKPEKDGTNFIKYEDDDEDVNGNTENEANEDKTNTETGNEITVETGDENHVDP